MDPLIQGYLSLSRDINKAKTGNTVETAEGVVGEMTPELQLSMSDEELIDLSKEWKSAWEPYQKELAKSQNDNENYWLGKQYDGNTGSKDGHPLADNLIFESLETFLPIATRPKADAVVTSENPELASKIQKMLAYWSESQAYNIKLKQVVRYWALYKLGIIKLGWSNRMNDITCVALRPQKLILDPDSNVDSGEYTGEYIGEFRKETARNIIKRFPKSKAYITEQAKDKLGTKMQYIEWWTDEYVFWTMDDKVLAKAKNPHWNYENTTQVTNEFGSVQDQKVVGNNHFNFPKKPYAMLTIFSLGLHPYDDTNLIQQNLSLQDLVNKRLRQMDRNADKTNGGIAVSGDSFTKEQASGVGKAVEKGGTLFVPNGDVNKAVVHLTAAPLPQFVYQTLIDYREELRNIFGVRGSSPQGIAGERTVRGKMFMQQQDQSRVGGGIAPYFEQFSEYVFNYVVQMMYVYYDEEHVGTIFGADKATEFVKVKSSELTSKLSISVKEGSMLPKDPVAQRDEVLMLWKMGAIDPITLFEKLDFPDPKKAAEQLVAWKMDPLVLFPELAQQMQPPKGKSPTETLNYKDAPEDVKREIEQQAGLQPSKTGGTVQTDTQLVSQGLDQVHQHQIIQSEAQHARLQSQQEAQQAQLQAELAMRNKQ